MNGAGPLEIRAEGFQLSTSEDRTQFSERGGNTDRQSTQRTDGNTTKAAANSGDGMESQAVVLQDGTDRTIRLDLETEDGKKQEIYIDDKGD